MYSAIPGPLQILTESLLILDLLQVHFLTGRNGMQTRIEKDSLGERRIPAEAYYGIQTDRAIENFPISGIKPKSSYIDATVHIKKAAAKTNKALGLLDARRADAIVDACDEILKGKLKEWFVIDIYQAGAGTSHNMNANEVIANRAIELLGGQKGDYSSIHPNDHVNMAQSTNDVCPTAIRIGALILTLPLLKSLEELKNTFQDKAGEFDPIIKSGRTHLQDAVPIRLGQEFGAYATCIRKHKELIERAADSNRELGIGGTAVGTGLNSHIEYRPMMVQELSLQLKTNFRMADNYFEAMQSLRPFVELSGAARNLAQDLIRIANDLRLLSSGPKNGIAEIELPELQPGSSIMPGKINPVMAEMLDMVCFQVIGCDTTILLAAQAGQLELNVMMPVVAYNLLHELEILGTAINLFNRRCVSGIKADVARCRAFAEASMSIVTVLNPHIGYAAAAEVAKEYLSSGKSISQLVIEKGLLTKEKIDEIFELRNMTEPGIR
jgi:aspartate ammonia-lyase